MKPNAKMLSSFSVIVDFILWEIIAGYCKDGQKKIFLSLQDFFTKWLCHTSHHKVTFVLALLESGLTLWPALINRTWPRWFCVTGNTRLQEALKLLLSLSYCPGCRGKKAYLPNWKLTGCWTEKSSQQSEPTTRYVTATILDHPVPLKRPGNCSPMHN